ncbi:uncharacterized protein LOC5515526 isoform X2 [Nematostella vectensis]|uniref:uncharacterized protein LOC5515526 isoform X2 n=1 Tax=Nematostella vectensis TaxID=45351 RepID=UPI002076EB26|nr:uncharacterized protein LOC5515526 isoform X2 [Nematostella vectensis]
MTVGRQKFLFAVFFFGLITRDSKGIISKTVSNSNSVSSLYSPTIKPTLTASPIFPSTAPASSSETPSFTSTVPVSSSDAALPYAFGSSTLDFNLNLLDDASSVTAWSISPPSQAINSLTICLWLRLYDGQSSQAVFTYGEYIQLVYLLDLKKMNFTINDYSRTFSSPGLFDGNWHHVCATWNSSALGSWGVMVDGDMRGWGLGIQGSISSNSNITIGKSRGALLHRGFVGQVSDAHLWFRSLQTDQLRTLSSRCGYVGDISPAPGIPWSSFKVSGWSGRVVRKSPSECHAMTNTSEFQVHFPVVINNETANNLNDGLMGTNNVTCVLAQMSNITSKPQIAIALHSNQLVVDLFLLAGFGEDSGDLVTRVLLTSDFSTYSVCGNASITQGKAASFLCNPPTVAKYVVIERVGSGVLFRACEVVLFAKSDPPDEIVTLSSKFEVVNGEQFPPGDLTHGISGEPGGSYSFNGSSSKFTLRLAPDVATKQMISILFWVYIEDAGNIMCFNEQKSGTGIEFMNSGKLVARAVTVNGSHINVSTTVIVPKRWYHVTWRITSEDEIKLIVRDNIVSDTLNEKVSFFASLEVGGFTGRLSCIQIYYRRVSRKELASLKGWCLEKSTAMPPPFLFDLLQGNQRYHMPGLTVQIQGNITSGPGINQEPNGSFQSENASAVIMYDFTTEGISRSTALTLVLWVRFLKLADNKELVVFNALFNRSSGVLLSRQSTGHMNASIKISTTYETSFSTLRPLVNEEWYMIGLTYSQSSSVAQWWINGELDSQEVLFDHTAESLDLQWPMYLELSDKQATCLHMYDTLFNRKQMRAARYRCVPTDLEVEIGVLTGITTRMVNESSIHVQWSPLQSPIPGFISGYMVCYAKSASNDPIASQWTSNTSLDIYGLQDGTLYNISVKVIGVGKALSSRTRHQQSTKEQLRPPRNLTAVNVTSTSFIVQWESGNPSLAMPMFRVIIVELDNGKEVRVQHLNIEGACFSVYIDSLEDMTMYKVQVKAVMAQDTTGDAAEVIVQTASLVPALAPANITTGHISKTSVTLDWIPLNISSKFQGYRVYYSLLHRGNVSYGSRLHIDVNESRVTLAELAPWSLYKLELLAFTPEYEGPNSTIYVQTLPPGPSTPEDIQVYRMDNTTIYVNWLPPTKEANAIKGYQVCYRSLNTIPRDCVMECSSVTALWVHNLASMANYSFQVSAFVEYEGEKSALFYPIAQQAPAAPPDSIFHRHLTTSAVTVFWYPPVRSLRRGRISSYHLKALEANSSGVIITNGTTAEKTVKINEEYISGYYYTQIGGLKSGTYYHIQVAAFTIALGPWSSTRLIKTLGGNDPEPTTTSTMSKSLITSPVTIFPTPISTLPIYQTIAVSNASMLESTPTSAVPNVTVAPSETSSVPVASSAAIDTWSQWSVCSRSCAAGKQIRKRACSTLSCQIESKLCNAIPCPGVTVNLEANLTYEVWTGDLLVHNSSQFLLLEEKIKQNVISKYSNKTYTVISDVQLIECREGSVMANFSIMFSSTDKDELLNLQENVDLKQMIGALPLTLVDFNMMTVPTVGPQITNVAPVNTSHTLVQWTPTDPVVSSVMGYRVKYRKRSVLSWSSCDCHACSNLYIHGLDAFTTYRIRVLGFTAAGDGIAGPAVEVRTPEGAPKSPVQNVVAKVQSSTQIVLEWDALDPATVPGQLRGYKIRYTANGTGVVTERIASTFSTSTVLTQLSPYMLYHILLTGFTAAGDGPLSSEVLASTAEDVPSAAPVSFTSRDEIDVTSVVLKWGSVPRDNRNGKIIGYHVIYKPIKIGYQDVTDKSPTHMSIPPDVTETRLAGLEPFSAYEISIRAFTSIGNGPMSKPIIAKTCRCPAHLYTSWTSYPPYVNSTGSDNVGGIFGTILQEMIDTICEECTNSHKRTTLHFDRDSRGDLAEKGSLLGVKIGIDEHTNIAFPVSGRTDDSRYQKKFIFLPLVQAPGIAFITRPQGSYTKVSLMAAIISCWPVVVLAFAMACLAGIVIWLIEMRSNADQFPKIFTRGIWEGFWWSFVSMTTVGYGDKVPAGPISRVVAIIWVLTGLVMISLFMSVLTSSMTITIVGEKIMLYGTEVAALINSTEYRAGLLKNARMKAYPTLQASLDALLDGEVKGILLDSYVAGSLQHMLSASASVEVNRVIEQSIGYGVVLGGPVASLEAVFRNYLMQNRQQVSRIIERHITPLEKPSEPPSISSSSDVTNVNSAFYRDAVLSMGVLLLLAVCIGLVWNYYYVNRFKKADDAKERLTNERKELKALLIEFNVKIHNTVKQLRAKHLSELKAMPTILRNRQGQLVTKTENISHWQKARRGTKVCAEGSKKTRKSWEYENHGFRQDEKKQLSPFPLLWQVSFSNLDTICDTDHQLRSRKGSYVLDTARGCLSDDRLIRRDIEDVVSDDSDEGGYFHGNPSTTKLHDEMKFNSENTGGYAMQGNISQTVEGLWKLEEELANAGSAWTRKGALLEVPDALDPTMTQDTIPLSTQPEQDEQQRRKAKNVSRVVEQLWELEEELAKSRSVPKDVLMKQPSSVSTPVPQLDGRLTEEELSGIEKDIIESNAHKERKSTTLKKKAKAEHDDIKQPDDKVTDEEILEIECHHAKTNAKTCTATVSDNELIELGIILPNGTDETDGQVTE